jgi:hypothetical protein
LNANTLYEANTLCLTHGNHLVSNPKPQILLLQCNIQNGRNYNHLWKKQDRSLASSPSLGTNQLTKQKLITGTNTKPNPSEETLKTKKC